MELKGHLAAQLRQLRLSGVMETLEARSRQAIDDQGQRQGLGVGEIGGG